MVKMVLMENLVLCKLFGSNSVQGLNVLSTSNKSIYSGKIGMPGIRGLAGKDGQIVCNIVDDHGTIIESASSRYQPRLQSFDIRTEPDHGIFEPGQLVLSYNFSVCNDGQLTLPQGCIIEILPSTGVLPLPQFISVPQIAPGDANVCQSGRLWGKIIDPYESSEPTKPGLFRAQTQITAQLTISFFMNEIF
jgi:hypothetical protein